MRISLHYNELSSINGSDKWALADEPYLRSQLTSPCGRIGCVFGNRERPPDGPNFGPSWVFNAVVTHYAAANPAVVAYYRLTINGARSVGFNPGATVKERFKMFRHGGGIYYARDTVTLGRQSLGTTDRAQATRLLAANGRGQVHGSPRSPCGGGARSVLRPHLRVAITSPSSSPGGRSMLT